MSRPPKTPRIPSGNSQASQTNHIYSQHTTESEDEPMDQSGMQEIFAENEVQNFQLVS